MSRTDTGAGFPADADEDGPPLDPASGAALIAAQRARVQAAIEVDGRVLFGAWGAAWLLGYGLLWLAHLPAAPAAPSPGQAGVAFAALLVAAAVTTTVHLARRTAGVHGGSATQGAMYGWAWFLSFAGVAAVGSALARAGASAEVMSTAMNLVPALLVGALYMAGAAIWQDRWYFVLGAWIGLVTVAGATVGLPHMLLLMSGGGGGGMLALAALLAVRRRASAVRGWPA